MTDQGNRSRQDQGTTATVDLADDRAFLVEVKRAVRNLERALTERERRLAERLGRDAGGKP